MTIIKKAWEGISKQFISDDEGNRWLITELIAQIKEQNLEEFEIQLQHLCISDRKIGNMTIRGFVSHVKQLEAISFEHPIILDEDGAIFDGRHRVAKALVEGNKTIKAVRFNSDPLPTITVSKEDKTK